MSLLPCSLYDTQLPLLLAPEYPSAGEASATAARMAAAAGAEALGEGSSVARRLAQLLLMGAGLQAPADVSASSSSRGAQGAMAELASAWQGCMALAPALHLLVRAACNQSAVDESIWMGLSAPQSPMYRKSYLYATNLYLMLEIRITLDVSAGCASKGYRWRSHLSSTIILTRMRKNHRVLPRFWRGTCCNAGRMSPWHSYPSAQRHHYHPQQQQQLDQAGRLAVVATGGRQASTKYHEGACSSWSAALTTWGR